ncbi:MAG: hypothetical protein ACRD42_05110 [Nitrososphaeraceae archaeon]
MPSTRSVKSFVKYTGVSDIRSLSKDDFKNAGIEGQGDVEFNHSNRWVDSVTKEAAAFLIGLGEFERTPEPQDEEE